MTMTPEQLAEIRARCEGHREMIEGEVRDCIREELPELGAAVENAMNDRNALLDEVERLREEIYESECRVRGLEDSLRPDQ